MSGEHRAPYARRRLRDLADRSDSIGNIRDAYSEAMATIQDCRHSFNGIESEFVLGYQMALELVEANFRRRFALLSEAKQTQVKQTNGA